ncbi:MAG TPA: HlyD family efflux transporter periplasmic adaptor subunit [Methylophilaceae bacterium]|nr:HlyD family efflux transporter periplasmic adaptor subunit [Methylophilaceae bacterium]
MSSRLLRRGVLIAGVVIIVLSSLYLWQRLKPAGLPAEFVAGNGRIEATEVDISTKTAGRIQDVLFHEGDFVEAGQVVARMDTQTMEADLHQMEARVKQAQSATATATATTSQRQEALQSAAALIAQRKQAKETALAMVAQSESEVAFAESEVKRSEELVEKRFITQQRLESDRTRLQSARAALNAAKSKVEEAQAAIEAAKSQLTEARSAIEASKSQIAETRSSTDAAIAAVEKIKADIADASLKTPKGGRVQYRVAEPGEVLPVGGKVLTVLDVSDVYMTFFLPETVAGRVAIGAEARLVLDAAPQYVIPTRVSFVASEAQFTPKTVETATERQKLVFRVKARIAPELLKQYKTRVKTGLPGVAYVQLDASAEWPANLQVKLPQ